MSRIIIYLDNRLHIVSGEDYMLGVFYQIFDKNLENETPEGEGLVFDWSQRFNDEINMTGIKGSPDEICQKYIEENHEGIVIKNSWIDRENIKKSNSEGIVIRK